MTFAEFKASRPARDIFRKMGVLEYLEAATSWRSLRALIVDFNGPDDGHFVTLVRDCNGVASSGERVLLHAICYVTDFAWLADELTATDTKKIGMAWRHMDRASGDHRRCVAACIGAEI
jgi:hypothetical protein